MSETQLISFRIDKETLKQLQAHTRQTGQSMSNTMRILLEEGIRMENHPGIVFRSGPAGRRPALAVGPDIWEIARLFQNIDERGEALVMRVAEEMDLAPDQVRIALRYYSEYKAEIDAWIQRLDEFAEREQAAWLREQELFGA